MKNKHLILLVAVLFLLPGCVQSTWNSEVNYAGALKNAMINGDITPKMQLSELEGLENLYALGAVGNLKGEIQIFNSDPVITSVEDGIIIFDDTLDKSASLIVYAQVKNWKEIVIPDEIETRTQFEEYLKKEAKKQGLDTEKPFPFLLNGNFKENDWHVIDWDSTDTIHTHEKHRESGLYGKMKNTELEMLGFFSLYHISIFTHHTTNMHLHFKTNDLNHAGHSDDFILGKDMVLNLPSD